MAEFLAQESRDLAFGKMFEHVQMQSGFVSVLMTWVGHNDKAPLLWCTNDI